MRKPVSVTFLAALAALAAAGGCTPKPSADKSTAAQDGGTAAKPTAAPSTDIPAPPDVAAPPTDAEKTASGLASKVLAKGTGADHPGANDTVTVNYTGWTTDGKMFDSSTKHGQPVTFPLSGVIKGWTEGLQLMVVGEKRRFWIPVELAYQNKPGRPAGMLVFDVELIAIKPGPKPPEGLGNEPPKGYEKSGELYTKVTTPGTGDQVKASDIARLQYDAWDTSGKLLDSTTGRGRPAIFKVDQGPPGLKDAALLMKVGEKRIVWVPRSLIGKLGPPDMKGDWLVLDMYMQFAFDGAPPDDVKAPPAKAKKEASGLASVVLKAGRGPTHPGVTDTVKVNYTGWTTDGKMFDSSWVHGGPAEFGLSGVIPGWTEGVQLMVPGEKRRFWIPEELAYKGKSGPQGMLVFDVELVEIVGKK
jgi:FKBP-type peptidyl-prolyl cis-trans isomerase